MRFLLALLGLVLAGSAAHAQDATAGPCATPDSVAFRGLKENSQITDAALRADVGIAPKTTINSRVLTRAITDLYATNQFEANIRTSCEIQDGKSILVFTLQERRVLSDIKVTGTEHVSTGSVRDRIDLQVGKPIDPAQVAKDITRIDSLYQSKGYFLAKVTVDTLIDPANPDATTLEFRIDESRRLAISGVEIVGNKALPASMIVHAISTKPEGFFWWRKGEFDQQKYAEDLAKTIPQLYAQHGYIDMSVVRDTMIVDRDKGKALVRLTVNEGPQYKIGDFEVDGAKRFSNADIARMYPFGRDQSTSLSA
jgi:outer membrane protein insertion porin family